MKKEKHINYLSELSDYKIASGYPDINGWDVKDYDNRVIGKVDNLLVNKETEKVVYLDVEVDDTIISAGHDPYDGSTSMDIREFINTEGENHIIIPIGLVDLHEEPNYVYTANIDHRTFGETKRIPKGTPIDRNYEVIILNSYIRPKGHKNLTETAYKEKERTEISDSEEERMEYIKKRDHIGEYRDTDELDPSGEGVDWYDAENEGLKDRYEMGDDDFYKRNEFDDSRFHRRKE